MGPDVDDVKIDSMKLIAMSPYGETDLSVA